LGLWVLAEEAVLGSILSQVSKRILEKLEKRQKLSTEDILLLYLDLTHKEIRELREEIRETRRELREEIRETRRELREEIEKTNRRIDETNKRIDETNKRIDRVQETLSARIDSVQKTLLAKIEETNKRIDELYKLYTELGSLGTSTGQGTSKNKER